MGVGIVLYTSTKGHFGYRDCYKETVEHFEKQCPSSDNGLLVNQFYNKFYKLAHIKMCLEADEPIMREMEHWLINKDFRVISSQKEWNHNDASHANGYYADMLKCFSDPKILEQELVLFIEDDWLISTHWESMFSVVDYAVKFMRQNPNKLCLRINRDTDKVPDFKILKYAPESGHLLILEQGPKATPYGPTMTFQPTFVRPREWYHALRLINNRISEDPDLLTKYHCELVSGDTMKVFSDDPSPFCFFGQSLVDAEHIGEKERCENLIK